MLLEELDVPPHGRLVCELGQDDQPKDQDGPQSDGQLPPA